jgi:hypothetical protein
MFAKDLDDRRAIFRTKTGVDSIQKYFEANKKLLADYIQLFEWLRDTWGTWKINDNQVVYRGSTDDTINMQYIRACNNNINDDSAQADKLLKEMSAK